MLTTRRSVAGGTTADCTGGDAAAVPSSDVPHSPQKRTPGAFEVPQLGHGTASRVPHSPQN